MIRKYPLSGGEYIYVKNTFGNTHAYICGWMIVLAYWSLIPLNSTALALVSRYILPIITPFEKSPFMFGYMYTVSGWDVYFGEILLAWFFIILLGLINIKGVRSFGRFQSIVALLMTFSVLFVITGVLIRGVDFGNLTPGFGSFQNGNYSEKGILACIFAVLAYTPYCFVGFDSIPQAAEEYKFSHKKTTYLMIAAIIAGGFIYAGIVFVTAVVKPWQETLHAGYDWATGEMILVSLGSVGVVLIGTAMLCAVISGINGFYMAASRLIYSMSEDCALPKKLGSLGNSGTPRNAILFLMILSMIAPFFGRQVLSWIVDMTCVGAAMGFIYTCLSAVKAATKDNNNRQKWLSVLGVVVSSIFLIETFIPGMPGFLSIQSWIILVVWVALGVIFKMAL